jgi:hypothetical protein
LKNWRRDDRRASFRAACSAMFIVYEKVIPAVIILCWSSVTLSAANSGRVW